METETEGKTNNLVRLDASKVKGKIKFNNVSFSYREDEQILNNINLEINPGEKNCHYRGKRLRKEHIY
ncbi:hypothetical protein [Ruminiclostridium josui]|uniref:hypothetical protein n=1 Tax=Ruminiclostridium josui TaxID=1499 RepID=UPI001FA7671D|nr:hypothetical protein [Ruminiclostridium josui]